jgi:hypothetical protein
MMPPHQIAQLNNTPVRVICLRGENAGFHNGILSFVQYHEPIEGTAFVIIASLQNRNGKSVVIRLRNTEVDLLILTPHGRPLTYQWDGVLQPELPVREDELV